MFAKPFCLGIRNSLGGRSHTECYPAPRQPLQKRAESLSGKHGATNAKSRHRIDSLRDTV